MTKEDCPPSVHSPPTLSFSISERPSIKRKNWTNLPLEYVSWLLTELMGHCRSSSSGQHHSVFNSNNAVPADSGNSPVLLEVVRRTETGFPPCPGLVWQLAVDALLLSFLVPQQVPPCHKAFLRRDRFPEPDCCSLGADFHKL